ncbi:ice-binding family protein [Streptosporangium sp. NBC_01756]|uniref:ice-binding family protein n=1 Tax=Streptosporangium sp. NBC_01756 TaxID=2975950 RepID=UPI002DD8B037|nr:ice-binding family protein [Streptosporangium sp. NBC_01756]WSC89624.1 ice-binding family protein [Streptosporangium sp. NBC_01756]
MPAHTSPISPAGNHAGSHATIGARLLQAPFERGQDPRTPARAVERHRTVRRTVVHVPPGGGTTRAAIGESGTRSRMRAEPGVTLGTAGRFAVLAGASVVNTGATVITGDLGVTPGAIVTGFPPGSVSGTIHVDDAVAVQAQTDFTTAYDDVAFRTPTATVSTDLGATTLTPGIYTSVSGTFSNTGNLTLDAEGDPDAIFIFQTVSTLLTAGASTVTLTGGAQARNVFWQVGTSATLGAGSTLSGTILALASITVGAGVVIDGRTLARDGTVTLDTDIITRQVGTLSISAPESVDLGSARAGGQGVSARLGPVTVIDERYDPDAAWIVTVSSTPFTTGAATPSQTIASSFIVYAPGTATATTGDATFTPGTPGDLGSPRVAFSASDGTGENSATWNPMITVTLPAGVRVGNYTATITHSVA